jgi:hypothetical protein
MANSSYSGMGYLGPAVISLGSHRKMYKNKHLGKILMFCLYDCIYVGVENQL